MFNPYSNRTLGGRTPDISHLLSEYPFDVGVFLSHASWKQPLLLFADSNTEEQQR